MNHRIEYSLYIAGGRPLIRGTCITVEEILRMLARPMTVSEVLARYPQLEQDDVYAALAFAADCLSESVPDHADALMNALANRPDGEDGDCRGT